MIRLIFGGKKNEKWLDEASAEYLKRLRKPFNASVEVMGDERLAAFLDKWTPGPDQFLVLADERGQIIDSLTLSERLQSELTRGRDITIVVGGAFGFGDAERQKADFLWSFSRLVFPHQIARLITIEQLYRAYSISVGGKYHHE